MPVACLCLQYRTDLAQCLCAHEVNKTHSAHVQDDGVEADVGRCCHHRVRLCCRQESASLYSISAAQLTGASTTGGWWLEGHVGDAGPVSSGLVVVGVCWRAAFKVFLELLQRQGLQQSRNAQSGQGKPRS